MRFLITDLNRYFNTFILKGLFLTILLFSPNIAISQDEADLSAEFEELELDAEIKDSAKIEDVEVQNIENNGQLEPVLTDSGSSVPTEDSNSGDYEILNTHLNNFIRNAEKAGLLNPRQIDLVEEEIIQDSESPLEDELLEEELEIAQEPKPSLDSKEIVPLEEPEDLELDIVEEKKEVIKKEEPKKPEPKQPKIVQKPEVKQESQEPKQKISMPVPDSDDSSLDLEQEMQDDFDDIKEKIFAETEVEKKSFEIKKQSKPEVSDIVRVVEPKEQGHRKVSSILDEAYQALLSGQVEVSIELYKAVLDAEYDNKDALFGLATAYHKNKQFRQAQATYIELLEFDPNHKEALNNYLAIVADVSPEDALIELMKLEKINPDFSPLSAQIAMIYVKMNDFAKAEYYLKKSISLDPQNISYIYNLAIVSDNMGKRAQAIALYKQVIQAEKTGAIIPGTIENIKDRLSYLESLWQ